ncbi:MAG: glycosyltransferase family A protein [Cyclobacteriaceae bacterium]
MPAISVIMPAFNAEPYIGEAISSILRQDFADFELIILNDGSEDDTLGVIHSFSDRRIVLINSDVNRGLVSQLNHGLKVANAPIIARMDADDTCHESRLRLQYNYLLGHPEVGFCATYTRKIGTEKGLIKTFEHDTQLRFAMLFGTPIHHGAVMMRKDVLVKHGLTYRQNAYPSEDYDLWIRMMRFTKLHVIPKTLSNYRIRPGQITEQNSNDQFSRADTLARDHFSSDYFVLGEEWEECYRTFKWRTPLDERTYEKYFAFLGYLINNPMLLARVSQWKFMVYRHLVQQIIHYRFWKGVSRILTSWSLPTLGAVLIHLVGESVRSKIKVRY